MRPWLALAFLFACENTSPVHGSDSGTDAASIEDLADGAWSSIPQDAATRAAPFTDAGSGDFYGTERAYAGAICSYLLKGNFRVAERDLRTSFVDGNDPLALVNLSGDSRSWKGAGSCLARDSNGVRDQCSAANVAASTHTARSRAVGMRRSWG